MAKHNHRFAALVAVVTGLIAAILMVQTSLKEADKSSLVQMVSYPFEEGVPMENIPLERVLAQHRMREAPFFRNSRFGYPIRHSVLPLFPETSEEQRTAFEPVEEEPSGNEIEDPISNEQQPGEIEEPEEPEGNEESSTAEQPIGNEGPVSAEEQGENEEPEEEENAEEAEGQQASAEQAESEAASAEQTEAEAKEQTEDEAEDHSAFPPEDVEAIEEESSMGDKNVNASKPEEHEEPQQPDNILGDEVIDFPRFSGSNDFGDMYVSGKDVEKNSYSFKQRRARSSMLYNSPDIFNVESHKPPCKYICKDDLWGPGCDGHKALANGDCEEVIDASGDRFIPVDKVAPATYDAYSGNANGLFKGQRAQALLSRQGARGRGDGAGGQSLWLGENWYIDGLQDDGNYMVPADEAAKEGYRNSLFDFGAGDGAAVDPESRMPAPGMTQFYRAGDGEKPGRFDLKAIRANEDGGLPRRWYREHEGWGNFLRDGSGKWAPGRDPSVMVVDGHVEYIDDGMRPPPY